MINSADERFLYKFNGSIGAVILQLENDIAVLIEWYKNNYLKLSVHIDIKNVFNSDNENILGVHFDNKLDFKFHINKLCKKASQKLHALARVSNFMSLAQRKVIMNAFVITKFCNCPLLWMCQDRKLHAQLNKIHERTLRIIYRDHIPSFEVFLDKSGSVTTYHRTLQRLAIEIQGFASLMSEVFTVPEKKYNLRNRNELTSNKRCTTNYGIGSVYLLK